MRGGLFREILVLAFDTVTSQRLRSALTILGILIGITAIVGMTAIVRGFDESLRETIREIGPGTIYVAQFSGVSLASGDDFASLMRRPSLTPDDAKAIGRQAVTIESVNIALGEGGPPTQSRLHHGGNRTKAINILGSTENYADVFHVEVEMGRFFTASEVSHRRRVIVLGQSPYQALFPNVDPIGKTVRLDTQRYRVIGVLSTRPSPGGLNVGQDDFAVMPHTSYQKHFGIRASRAQRGMLQSALIAAQPFEDIDRDDAMREVESIMRIRHGLRLDDRNDFDLMTQESVMRLWDRISQATFLALVAISSIAQMVGGIGVMAIMTITVKERTREIGTAAGAGSEAARDSVAVSPRSGLLDGCGRCARGALRKRYRSGRPLRDWIPDLPPVVVLCDRNRLFDRRWYHLRHRPGAPGVRTGPDRSAPLRVDKKAVPGT